MKLNDAQAAYADTIGRYWESVGFSRAGSALLAWLMICEPAHQSQAELATALRLSRGSVSTQLRTLEGVGLTERIRFPGERTQYYQLPEDVWLRVMRSEGERIAAMKQLAEAGAEVLPATRQDRITQLGEVAAFFEEVWPQVTERMNARFKKGTP
jgi:DNA-binding transcriptional regulator GbsR (MarR family)